MWRAKAKAQPRVNASPAPSDRPRSERRASPTVAMPTADAGRMAVDLLITSMSAAAVLETHLVVREVPSLRAVRRLPLTAAPGVRPSNPYQPYNGMCLLDTGDAGTISVIFGGYATRYELSTGRLAGQVRLWGASAGLTRLAGMSTCAARPGREEIAFNAGGAVEVWNVAEGRQVARLPFDRPTAAMSVAFSADGRHLAVLGLDGALDVWDLARRQATVSSLTVLPTGLLYPQIVAFPAGDRIIVRIAGGLRIWDLAQRAIVAEADIDSGPAPPSLTPDGGTLLLWMRSAALMRMPVDPARWAEHLCRAAGRDLTRAERDSLPAGSPAGRVCP